MSDADQQLADSLPRLAGFKQRDSTIQTSKATAQRPTEGIQVVGDDKHTEGTEAHGLIACLGCESPLHLLFDCQR